jgi:hypothetical protein
VSVVLLSVWYYYYLFAAVDGQGGAPVPLSCNDYWTKYATAPFSHTFGQSECGLQSGNCGPSDDWVTVRCDGWCTQSPSPVVGSGPFRPDSKVCTAGVYAGLVGVTGGCLRFRPASVAEGFVGGESHGVTSVAFKSWYPFGLELAPADGSEHCGYGGWWGLLLLNAALLMGLTFLRPGRRLCWWCLVVAFYWYCALVDTGGQDMEGVMQSLGIFALYALAAHVLLWEVGGAKVFFPDTALGAPLEVLLLEVLPMMPFLHIQLMAYVVGDYDLTGALLQAQDRAGLLVYCVGVLLLVPGVVVILWDWHRAGKLRRFVLKTLAGVIAIVLFTLLFSTQNYGIHLHHYFVGLVGYLAARGPSRTAAVVRALSLGAFINGMARWGEPTGIPIWSLDPITETVATSGPTGDSIQWTDVNALVHKRAVQLWWAPASEIEEGNCSVAGEEGPQVVVEMNHVEVYRGHKRSQVFPLPQWPPTSGEEPYYYFRVGLVSTGPSTSGVASASQVLAVKAGDQPVDMWRNETGACDRRRLLQNQPASSLRGYL